MSTTVPPLRDTSSRDMAIGKPCAVCGEESNLRCSGCKMQHYCGKEHQISHWKTVHKNLCRTFRIERSETLGRYVVAARDLPPGTIVLREEPLVIAPKQWTRPLCLGCFRYVGENSPRCSSCGWPMCGPDCSRTPQHQAECIYTRRRQTLIKPQVDGEKSDAWKICIKQFDQFHPMYFSVALLRCLYLKDHDKTAWEKLMSLESHTEKRKKRREREGPSAGDDEWVTQFTRAFFCLDESAADDLRKIIGIFMVNGHEVPLPELTGQVGEASSFVALYHNCSFFEHSCIPNCRKSFPKLDEIIIRTTGFVAKGERLSICYTDPFWGTIDRKKHLFSSKYFNCHCRRCEDPTELGTFISGLKCLKCADGYCVPVKHSSAGDHDEDETIDGYSWECWGKAKKDARKELGCGNSINYEDAKEILTDLGKKLAAIEENDIKETNNYLRLNTNTALHKNHHYILGARVGLLRLLQSRLYSNPTRIQSKEIPEVKLLERTAKDLLDVMDIICPGMTEIRGILLYELYSKRVSNFLDAVSKQKQPRGVQRELIVGMRESVDILSLESEGSASAAMAVQGRQIVRNLDKLSDLIILQ